MHNDWLVDSATNTNMVADEGEEDSAGASEMEEVVEPEMETVEASSFDEEVTTEPTDEGAAEEVTIAEEEEEPEMETAEAAPSEEEVTTEPTDEGAAEEVDIVEEDRETPSIAETKEEVSATKIEDVPLEPAVEAKFE